MTYGSFAQDDPDRPRWDARTVEEAVYDYENELGEYCFSLIRGSHPDGVKRFTIRRKNMIPFKERFEPEDKVDWFSGMGGLPHMLYHLHELIAADAMEPVIITEGEKDADNIANLGFITTTNSSGAGKWKDEYSAHLTGRDVIILPDNDAVGWSHADKILRSVHGVARSVKIIELPNLPDKGDATDWIKAGNSREDLLSLIEQTPPIADVDEWISQHGQFKTGKNGKLGPSPENAYIALKKLGVSVSYNEFSCRYVIFGLEGFGPYLDDMALTRLRLETEKQFGITYTKDRWYDIVTDYAHCNSFHPVRQYLDGLKWDGVPRLDLWLVKYAGAEDNEYVRTVGALTLIAAVRRVRQPGAKFDQMLVIEGEQGTLKSSALAIMAVHDEWFADDVPLDADSKLMMEQTSGRWIVEGAELKGIRQAESEKIKANLSRRIDSARLVYNRMSTEQPRQFVFIGTTNSDDYLRDMTGNRRFWPVKIVRFDVDALAADRDQLWAEAANREQSGASIELPRHLWEMAARYQGKRVAIDPFEEILFGPLLEAEGKIQSEVIWRILGLTDGAKRSQAQNSRLGSIMKKHGWKHGQLRFNGLKKYGYIKGDGSAEVPHTDLFSDKM